MPAYINGLYESNSGEKHPIRLSPDYFAAAGAPPAEPATSDINVKVSKTNKEFGIRPRRVRLARIVGTGDESFRKYATLAVLTPTAFASDAFAKGATITIGDNDYEIVAKQEEDY